MALFDEDQLERIHLTSMRILEELGIELMSPRALALFEASGADVDHSTMTVRVDRGMVEAALATAPSRFRLAARNPERDLEIGGAYQVYTLVAGPPNVHDRERGRRAGNYADYCDFVRLAHAFNAIHMIGNQVCAPMELSANSRHLDTYLANLCYSDRAFHLTAIGRGRVMDGVHMTALGHGLTLDQMRTHPAVMTIISVNSPRRFDAAMADGLMAMAEYGQPVTVTPFTLMGAMCPVTLPAALAQQNAEALFGIILAQLVNPGVPVLYGAFTSNVDMRSGAPAFGTPENTQANVASGQLARRYGLPYRTSNSNASNAVDAQAAYETGMALWGAVLGHANVIYHAAGWLEGGLTASFEKFVLDVELLQHMMAFLTPVAIDDDSLGFDAIAGVSSGGHFFGEPHTMARYETAFYQPLLSDWRNYEQWQEAGAEDATERATRIWKEALRVYREPPMDSAIREALNDYVARRRREIGTDEP
jgi:trimethylamine--corrinoid protein Co-methyltransferase